MHDEFLNESSKISYAVDRRLYEDAFKALHPPSDGADAKEIAVWENAVEKRDKIITLIGQQIAQSICFHGQARNMKLTGGGLHHAG